MKLFSLLATLCICQLALAQPETSFIGTITYSVKAPEKAARTEEMRMTIHFGPNKMYLKMSESGKEIEDEILIDLDSGKLYTIMHAYKSYKVQKLAVTDIEGKNKGTKSVLGYNVESVPLSGASTASSMLRMLPMMGNLYVAKDLVFRVPRRYVSAPELMFVVNDHILLKADLDMGNWVRGMDEEQADNHSFSVRFELEATEVKNSLPGDIRFEIPAGYQLRKRNEYSYMMGDTTMVEAVDSVSYWADSAAVAVDTAVLSDYYPGQRVVPVEVISDEGRVAYATVWLSSNKEYPTYGVDYKIVGRWVPKKKNSAATRPKTGTKPPARKPKNS
jgi:hypothetical protein